MYLCRWEEEMARERTDYLPSYAKAKKMKSLILRVHGCLMSSLKDCCSSPRQIFNGFFCLLATRVEDPSVRNVFCFWITYSQGIAKKEVGAPDKKWVDTRRLQGHKRT